VFTARQLLRHPDAVSSIALSPDGQHVLTTCADKLVRLWSAARGELVAAIMVGQDHKLRMLDARSAADVIRWRDAKLAEIRRQRRAIDSAADRKPGTGALDGRAAELARREL